MLIKLTDEQVAQVVAEAAVQKSVEQSVEQQVLSGLRPGMVVADVGGGEDEGRYEGTLDWGTLDRLDRLFYARHPELWAAAGRIFTSKPVLVDPDTGIAFHQGDIATADLSSYDAAGSKFGPYL